MLTIFNDPAGVTGRRRVPLDYSITLQQNIERHLSGGADTQLRINGEIVNPLTDVRLDRPPARDDKIAVVLRPRGGDFLNVVSFGLLGGPAVSSLLPKLPGQDGAAGKDSPNNRLTAQSNIARTYQAVPDIYGFRRIWPDIIQTSVVEYVDHVKYVTEWLCLSRGKGTVTQVQYADTPIEDIDGSSYELFEPVPDGSGYPENGTTTLIDVYEAFASDEVNGQELPYAVAFPNITKTGTYSATLGNSFFTVTFVDGSDLDSLKSLAPIGTAQVAFQFGAGPTDFDQLCTVQGYVVAGSNVTFTFSSGTWASNEAGTTTFLIDPTGNSTTVVGPFTMQAESDRLWWNTAFLRGLVGSVQIRAEWWRIDSAGVEVPGTLQTQDNTYTAGTYDQRFYTNKVTPSGGLGRYRIQFRRLSVQVDANGADVAKVEEVYAIRYYPTKELPGVTAARITTKATLAATGFSDRKFNARWLRHVRPLVDGAIGPSRNFGRAIAHLWTLAGNDIDLIDVDALAEINAEFGENSPLLRFDGSLDDADMSLGERMQFIADTARVFVWRDGTRWTFTRDQARSSVDMQFDYRNLAAKGQSVIAFSSTLPASQDGVEVEYVDETTQAKKSYVRLNISSGAVAVGSSRNPKKIKMLGCATQAQAENRAQLEARRLLFQRVTVNDTALADAMAIGPGALVRWIDPEDFGGDELQAGEVLAISGDLIQTSEPLQWGSETIGRIMFTGEDGLRIGTVVECYPTADGLVQLASVPSGLYVADATRQCGSRYAFAAGLTSDEMEAAGLFSVTNLRPSGDGSVALSLASYDDRIYEGDTA